jgi:anti-sigma regulatory factor (Ser/Thr protein kinase)
LLLSSDKDEGRVALNTTKSTLHLHLNGCKEGLQALQDLAGEACKGACLTAVQMNRVALALDELFANIHKHGYNNQGGDIECSAKRIGGEDECLLEITLRDFAPTITDVTRCKGVNPDTLKENPVAGGLGMHLIYATTMLFEHTPLDDGNQWRLVFDLSEQKVSERDDKGDDKT